MDAKELRGVTIVGGRPMQRAVEVDGLPQGVEQLLALAGLDSAFRDMVARDPIAAAASKGIALDEAEAALLTAMPAPAVAQMAELMIVPRRNGRRRFIKAVSASILAMVTGNAIMLCSCSTGLDTYENGDGAFQTRWMSLAGYTCYVCHPTPTDLAHRFPVLVALHHGTETCLASARRWQAVCERFGVCLVAINWTAYVHTPGDRALLSGQLDELISALPSDIGIDHDSLYLSAVGSAADLLLGAALLGSSSIRWKAASLLGGVPEGHWSAEADTLLATLLGSPPRLYYVLGRLDASYEQGVAFAAALVARWVPVHFELLEGSTQNAVLSFSDIWRWMANGG